MIRRVLPFLISLLAVAAPLAQSVTFRPGIYVTSIQRSDFLPGSVANNATNEMAGSVGLVELQAGTGSKTCSAAGGCFIVTYMSTVTWATASSEYRVGLEDVSGVTGLPDGTQDVYGAKVAGTDAITADAYNTFTTTSGTKTVAHGDRVGLTGRMPVRAGADTLSVGSLRSFLVDIGGTGIDMGLPYGMSNGAKSTELMWGHIVFDDGTYGWIKGTQLMNFRAVTSIALNTGTTPDELVAGFTVPIITCIDVAGWNIDDVGAGDHYEIVLYRDPFGTISTIQTIALDATINTAPSASQRTIGADATPVCLQPGQTGGYGISIRPTTANSITVYYEDLGSGFNILKAQIPFLGTVRIGSRVDNSGAFTEVQTYHVPLFFFRMIGFGAGLPSSVH